MGEDYMRTARSKGLSERVVIWRHAFNPIRVPLITVIGLSYAGLLEGSVMIETVFSWPGIGSFAIEALADLPRRSRHGLAAFGRRGLDVTPMPRAAIDQLNKLELLPGTSVVNPIDAPAYTLRQEEGRIAERILDIVLQEAKPDAVVMHINLPVFLASTIQGVDVVQNLVDAAMRARARLPGIKSTIVMQPLPSPASGLSLEFNEASWVQVFSREGRSLRVNAAFRTLWGVVPGPDYCVLDDVQLQFRSLYRDLEHPLFEETMPSERAGMTIISRFRPGSSKKV